MKMAGVTKHILSTEERRMATELMSKAGAAFPTDPQKAITAMTLALAGTGVWGAVNSMTPREEVIATILKNVESALKTTFDAVDEGIASGALGKLQ